MSTGNGPGARTSVLALILAAIASGAVVTVAPRVVPELTRPDAFTGAQADELRVELLREMHHQQELMLSRLASHMPPDPTRLRIEAIEDALRELQPEFRPGSNRFSEPIRSYP